MGQSILPLSLHFPPYTFPKMYFDRFDIISAHYQFAADYHGGQYSDLYAKLSRISSYFRPGIAWSGYDSLTDNGQSIYDNLVEKLGA